MFGGGDVLEYDDFYRLMRARGKKGGPWLVLKAASTIISRECTMEQEWSCSNP